MRDHPPAQAALSEKMQALPPDLTVHQVALRLNVSLQEARKWCRTFHYHAITQLEQKRQQKVAAMQLLPPYLTIRQVADLMGVDYLMAWHRSKRYGYQTRPVRPPTPPDAPAPRRQSEEITTFGTSCPPLQVLADVLGSCGTMDLGIGTMEVPPSKT